jgi:hypothetical protein
MDKGSDSGCFMAPIALTHQIHTLRLQSPLTAGSAEMKGEASAGDFC